MMANPSRTNDEGARQQMSIAIIANPLAGRGRGKKTAELAREILTAQNVDFQLIFTEHAGHAVALAQKASRNHEVVTALGGDGTIREVLEGVWQSSATLGIIPGGTGNDYARGLNIPRQVAPAIKVLLGQYAVPFDLGVETDLAFGVSASIGFPVDVLEHVNSHRDGIWKGQSAFLAGVVATVRSLRTYPVKITIDEKVLQKQVVALFVMNMPYSGGGMKFTPDAHYADGLFHILLIEQVTKLDLAFTLPKIYSGNHINHHAVSIYTGREIQVESEPLPIMLDGDIFSSRPLQAKIISKATKVLIPKAPIH